MIEIKNRQFADPDAVFVIDALIEELPVDWQRHIIGECNAGEEFWAVEMALQGAVEVGIEVSDEVLQKAEYIAVNSDDVFAKRLRRFIAELE